MRICLVGGLGFIGHHLALALDKKHEVLILDSLGINNLMVNGLSQESYRILRERINLVQLAGIRTKRVDARDKEALTEALAIFEPEVVVHLAAIAHMDRSQKDPHLAFQHNVLTLANSLEASRSADVKRFVFFSSSTVYGDFKQPHAEETDICLPKTVYGVHKRMGEMMVKNYGESYGLSWTIIRPQALYGPRCISGRVTQRFAEQAERDEHLVVQGNGQDLLDFTHVEDVIQGTTLAIESEKAKNEIFNIAAGNAVSLIELIEIIKKRYPDLEYQTAPLDMNRPKRGTMSIEKAKRLLGYEPKYQIAEGMNDYIDWYKGFLSGKSERRGTQDPRRDRAASLAEAAN